MAIVLEQAPSAQASEGVVLIDAAGWAATLTPEAADQLSTALIEAAAEAAGQRAKMQRMPVEKSRT